MRAPRAPRLDPRRAPELAAELRERARAWIPSWGLADGERDFGRALLEIAARFSSEVAEHLDQAGEKMRRGFLDWLGVRGEAARPARVPVAFKLAATARAAVLAAAPVRLQADADGTSVTFETEADVRLVPGRLQVVVGVDSDIDAFYLPPPGLSDLAPLEPLPNEWQLKSFAAAGAGMLQLDPETGLAAELVLETGGQQYRVVQVKGEIVSIDPPLSADLPAQTVVRKVTAFSPFDGAARNRQEHALYLGHPDLLNVEAAATIDVVGAQALGENVVWQYWGKVDPNPEVGWQTLAPAPPRTDAVVLTKPKGAIEPREIGAGRTSRWIRAYSKTAPAETPFGAFDLGLRLNASSCSGTVKCPPTQSTASPAAEAMANTTPLVLDNVFFPLGREPRQFDAFYLGSAEAFSKKGAQIQLCFEMADPTFASLSKVGGRWPNVLAGVAADRALHLLTLDPTGPSLNRFLGRDPLQPPSTTPLDPKPSWRLPVWGTGGFGFDFAVGTTAGPDVWIWNERFFSAGGWQPFGQVPATLPSSPALIDGLVFLAGPGPKLAALRDGLLALRDWPDGTQWQKVETSPVVLKSIVPVFIDDGQGHLVTSTAAGLIGTSTNGKLFRVDITGACQALLPTFTFNTDVRPAAALDGAVLTVMGVDISDPPRLVTRRGTTNKIEQLEAGAKVELALEVMELAGGPFQFLAAVTLPTEGYLASWAPFDPSGPATLFKVPVPASVGRIGGAPTALDHHVVIPGPLADVLVAAFDFTRRLLLHADVKSGFVVPASAPVLKPNDAVTLDVGLHGPFKRRIVTDVGTAKDGEVFYPIDQTFGPGSSGVLYAFRSTGPSFTGDADQSDATLKLDPGDLVTVEGMLLLIQNKIHRVTTIKPVTTDRFATLDPAPGADATGVAYWSSFPIDGRLAPFMRLDSANNQWDAALLDRVSLIFTGASPEKQRGKAFTVAPGNRPVLVVLGEDWTAPPVPGVGAAFLLDSAVGAWSRVVGDTSSNPELSWEYSDGRGWWKLDITLDETRQLKSTGAVRFTVPADLRPMDWAGRTNHWIRARLVGGDYGREKVTVTTKPTGNPGETQQSIERSSEGIRAPSVVKLHISYRICQSTLPAFVLTQDSGSMRDQSDANRTAGAVVEAFVPLAVTLGRLSGPAAAPEAPEGCPPPCRCPSGAGAGAATALATPPTAAPTRPAAGRALLVGLDAALSEAPVNVLLLVEEERPHELFAPMKIEALVADRFVPVVAADATRALGESGLLSMAFALPPTPRELFGVENLTWLRLTPGGSGPVTEWRPTLRGAYLNAVWASAAETLTRELLGSSEGAPDLGVRLARPPVLRGSLELRVKEPLGEEERQALLTQDENLVLSAVDGLPGDWVLWQPVLDPGDEPATARVYALDEATGEIRFGDGQHGAIPPIGRDSIVAFSYRRTEPGDAGGDDVPANAVAARTALNLVSPVVGVEAVLAADRAAGGAPPESAERVLRFGTARLRHRRRAVTARDLEDLALESSPDVVQARCLVRGGQARLVVVLRGGDPRPDAAEVRELRRLLLAAAPAALAAPGALQIVGPRIRRLRVVLKLRVASLDHAGEVSSAVEGRIAALLDSATGGADGGGWALGASPSEEEVALALLDTRRLEGLARVTLEEVAPDGAELPWPAAVKPDELAMLDQDAVRFEFETVEVIS